MTTIASPHNPRLQELRRLRRRRERARSGRFLAEGEDLVAAARCAGWPAVAGFRAAGSGLGGAGFLDVEPATLAEVSTLGSGARVIGVYEQRWLAAPRGPVCVYLHGVADPGNVGAVLRAALAFGASCVALGPGCADPCSPKAVRAGMGAIFAVPLARASAVEELPGKRIALVADRSRETLASDRFAKHSQRAHPRIDQHPRFGQRPPTQTLETVRRLVGPAREGTRAGGEEGMGPSGASGVRVERPGAGPSAPAPAFTLLVGAEREGLPAEVVADCEHVAYIPIASDSLNAAQAATVALYEMTRGWRSRPEAGGPGPTSPVKVPAS